MHIPAVEHGFSWFANASVFGIHAGLVAGALLALAIVLVNAVKAAKNIFAKIGLALCVLALLGLSAGAVLQGREDATAENTVRAHQEWQATTGLPLEDAIELGEAAVNTAPTTGLPEPFDYNGTPIWASSDGEGGAYLYANEGLSIPLTPEHLQP